MKKSYKIILLSVLLLIIIIIAIIFIVNNGEKNKEIPAEIKAISHGLLLDNEKKDYKDIIIDNYDEYLIFIKEYSLNRKMTENDFKNYSYLVVYAENDYCGGKITGIKDVNVNKENINIDIGIKASCGPCAPEYEIYLVALIKDNVKDNYKVNYNYITENKTDCDPNISYKPMIYLYPEKQMAVTVRLGYPEKLTTTYPKYKGEWNVLAKPNGDLIDLKTGRGIYGLYWEGINSVSDGIQEDGFVVKGEDTIEFFESKLSILGLTEREANEFIIYWLPILEENKYNYIRFETIEEIESNMPLVISPKPDTVIRILMEYKGLDEPIEVKEQQLKTPIRNGFIVVEWGGTEIN